MNLQEIFAGVPDPRINRRKLHSIEDILTLTLLATICGVKSWENIELFGHTKRKELEGVISFRNGVPSHDTLERVFSLINPSDFTERFIKWTRALCGEVKGELIAIDGKTARRSHKNRDKSDARHIISAWANQNRLVLGQFSTSSKGHEIEGIKELLALLDIRGSVISIDALGCQKEIARQITDQGADYILALKENQPRLHQEAVESFLRQKPVAIDTQIDKGHGRLETRSCSIISELNWVESSQQWAGIKTLVRIDSVREIHGEKQCQTRYYISSLKENAATFNQLIRGHWGIENSVHWTLDMVFREDECRKRKGYSAENFALVTKIALNLLKRDNRRISAIGKQHLASWNTEYLLALLNN